MAKKKVLEKSEKNVFDGYPANEAPSLKEVAKVGKSKRKSKPQGKKAPEKEK